MEDVATPTLVDSPRARPDYSVHLLAEAQVAQAERIFRIAFGTFVGMLNPLQFMGDADLVGPRWRADPRRSFGVSADGELIGSNFASDWGSFGFFGPLTITPHWWGKGAAHRLIDAAMESLSGKRLVGLFTFAHSPMHMALYQKHGFSPRMLTVITSKAVAAKREPPGFVLLGQLGTGDQERLAAEARELTDGVFPGLDVRKEMVAVVRQSAGDVVALLQGSRLSAFAVCHCGPGSEGGTGVCYIKFGAARSGPGARLWFQRLLDACECLASQRGLAQLQAGVNTARVQAYSAMLTHRFRIEITGVAMHRPNDAGYCRPDAFVIDDWR